MYLSIYLSIIISHPHSSIAKEVLVQFFCMRIKGRLACLLGFGDGGGVSRVQSQTYLTSSPSWTENINLNLRNSMDFLKL